MRYLILIMFILSALSVKTQTHIKGYIADSLDLEPVESVNIIVKGTKNGVASDSNGFFHLKVQKMPAILELSHVKYQNKTLTVENNQTELNILIKPEIYELGTATVKPIVNISNGLWLDILDYEIFNNKILVSAYCYNHDKKSNPWIYQLSLNGDTISRQISGVEGSFFTDCMGNVHYLTNSTAYQLEIGDDSVSFIYPESIDKFNEFLEACVLETADEYVFRQFVTNDQIIKYYAVNKESKKWRNFFDVADDIGLNMLKYRNNFYAMGKKPTEADLRFEKMCFFDSVYAPMIKLRDSIFLFNFTENEIKVFDLKFNEMRSVETDFHHLRDFQEVLIPDIDSCNIYALFKRRGYTYIMRIDLNSGKTSESWKIPDYKWVNNISVNRGVLYFLYRRKFTGDLVSLFKMKL